jgi:hypothetical protein
MQQMNFLLQILPLAQHVSGTIMPIIRSSTVLYQWLLPVVFSAVKMEIVIFKLAAVAFSALSVARYIRLLWGNVGCRGGCVWGAENTAASNLKIIISIFTAPNTTGRNHLYNTLELLMMGIMVTEIC